MNSYAYGTQFFFLEHNVKVDDNFNVSPAVCSDDFAKD